MLAVHGQIDAELAPPRSDDSIRPYYSYYHPPGPRHGAGSLTQQYDLAAITSSHTVNHRQLHSHNMLAVHGQIDAQLAPPRSDDSVRPYYSCYHPPGPRHGADSRTQ